MRMLSSFQEWAGSSADAEGASNADGKVQARPKHESAGSSGRARGLSGNAQSRFLKGLSIALGIWERMDLWSSSRLKTNSGEES
jgi:hypothetical protein